MTIQWPRSWRRKRFCGPSAGGSTSSGSTPRRRGCGASESIWPTATSAVGGPSDGRQNVGQEAHVAILTDAILTDGPLQQQLWIGLPGQNPAATSFTVSARPLNTSGVGRFSLITDDRQQELLVNSGARSAAEFPPHWVLAADLPQPGCWAIGVSGDQVDDTVVLPVPAVDDTNNP